MSDSINAATVRRAMDALNAGDYETFGELVHDDVVWHMIGVPEPARMGATASAARRRTAERS